MTKPKVITLPAAALRQPSKSVAAPFEKLQPLIKDMIETTLNWEAGRNHEVSVAMAAVQINQPWRVVVIRQEYRDKSSRDFEVMFNPEITRFDGTPLRDLEGCLSVKHIYAEVDRYPRIKIKALDQNGLPIKRVVKGFAARLLQHEIDHTNGITIVDRCGAEGTYFELQPDGKMHELSPAQRATFLKKVGLKQIKDKGL